jgi:hypothetical protein
MVQVRTNHNNISQFAPAADVIVRTGVTVARDAARGTADMADLTVMAVDSTGDLIPLTDKTAVDGTQIPIGLLKGTIDAADIVAGDVTGQRLYKSGKFFVESQVVLENSLTLDDEITVSAIPTAIATITSPDATDLSTAETLVNEIKASINTAVAAGNVASMTISIRNYLEMIGIFIQPVESVAGYENT